MKYHKLEDKKMMIIAMEGELKDRIIGAVKVEHDKGNYTTISAWVRNACVAKLNEQTNV
jgi:hypothetical protein